MPQQALAVPILEEPAAPVVAERADLGFDQLADQRWRDEHAGIEGDIELRHLQRAGDDTRCRAEIVIGQDLFDQTPIDRVEGRCEEPQRIAAFGIAPAKRDVAHPRRLGHAVPHDGAQVASTRAADCAVDPRIGNGVVDEGLAIGAHVEHLRERQRIGAVHSGNRIAVPVHAAAAEGDRGLRQPAACIGKAIVRIHRQVERQTGR